MWKHSGASSAEALWRVVCESAISRRLHKRNGTTPAEALCRDPDGSALA